MDPIMNPKVMTTERGVGARSLAHNISKVEKHVGAPKWGTRKSEKQVNYSHKLNKPNNKLISA